MGQDNFKATKLINTKFFRAVAGDGFLDMNLSRVEPIVSGFKDGDKIVIMPAEVFARIVTYVGTEKLVKLWEL